jgi:hypothetical protein
MFCTAIILCLLDSITTNIQVTERRKYFPRGHKLKIQRSLDLLFFLFYSPLWTSVFSTFSPIPFGHCLLFFNSHYI